MESPHPDRPPGEPRIVVVMPAFNTERTLRKTYEALPKGKISHVIVVDDASQDNTVRVARELGLEVFVHKKNYGYGANQKTCYIEALRAGADIVVMVHSDYQYDPTLLPEMVEPILQGRADVVLGSRLKGKRGFRPILEGMPWWRWLANRFLTVVENLSLGLRLSEYHTGYRAYTRQVLETCPFESNSDRVVFDQEIIAQIVAAKFRIAEIEVPVRYFPGASSTSFLKSCIYGCDILWLALEVLLHRSGLMASRRFQILRDRYQRAD